MMQTSGTSACLHCGSAFTTRSTGGRPQKYCSAKCRTEHHALLWAQAHPPVTPAATPNTAGGRTFTCEYCGRIATSRLRAGGRRQRFCSEKCGVDSYNERHPERLTEHLLRQYGLTPEQYMQMLDDQGGVCKICGRPPQNNRLAVDHDHNTGAVRGLLCAPCNRHVGYFEAFGPAVLAYLQK